MKKITIIGLSAALVSILIFASLAMARGGGPGFQGGPRDQGCPVFSGMTEEQQQEVLGLIRSHREEIYPKMQLMIARGAELNALLATDGPDSAELERIRGEMSSLNQEIFEARLNQRIELNRKYGIQSGKGMFGERKGSAGFERRSGRDCPRFAR
ncbi:periplasmic heavy metal sensor [Desulfonatronovibrio hydrogenovorans]|uniref:periplasmic heavy metal sensor n=1 Tax=Desulfonatronovibrio hydrogenovorans TaxID=53245 RepID=UPI00048CE372|nr:periplasmic heavy metal sensor [Desulfonatronovibrio hydrogenovorans]